MQSAPQELVGVRHGWLVQEITPEVLQAAAEAGVHGLYPRANVCTAEGIAAAHAAGLSVRAWGVHNLQVAPAPLCYCAHTL